MAVLSLICMQTYSQEADNPPPPTPVTGETAGAMPPVAQPLVPEGAYATQLLEALKLGQEQEETQAESRLSEIGIEPKNGWIDAYPVTPAVVGEIRQGVEAAAEKAKLGISKEQALKALTELNAKLGFNIGSGPPSTAPTSPSQQNQVGKPAKRTIYKYTDKTGIVHLTDQYSSVPQEYRSKVQILEKVITPQSSLGSTSPIAEAAGEQGVAPPPPESEYAPIPNPEDINDYYYEDGPPIVTYYPPPDPYYYLYSWVPYPFWYTGYYLPGFFILNDFHKHIFFHHHSHLITNHGGAGIFHHRTGINLANTAIPVNRSGTRLNSAQIYTSPKIQSSARAIVSTQSHPAPLIGRMPAGTHGFAPQPAVNRPYQTFPGNRAGINTRVGAPMGNFVPAQPRQQFLPPQHNFRPPTYYPRYQAPVQPRFYNPPAFSHGHAFAPPPAMGGGNFYGGHPAGGGGAMGGGHHR